VHGIYNITLINCELNKQFLTLHAKWWCWWWWLWWWW